MKPCRVTVAGRMIAERLLLSDATGEQYAFLHRRWVAGDALHPMVASARQLIE